MKKGDANDILREQEPEGVARAFDVAEEIKSPRENGADEEPPDRGAPPIGEDGSYPQPSFRTLREFEYKPIAYVVEGLLCSGSLYTLTGKTGIGKTGWMISTALAIVTDGG